MGVAIDSVTVEFDLTVDGTANPSVVVAPDIRFIPAVSYGQIIASTRESRLMLTLKNAVSDSAPGGTECDASEPKNQLSQLALTIR